MVPDCWPAHAGPNTVPPIYATVAAAADTAPRRRHRHLLICYLLDVNALFVGDGTRCAAAVRVRHARRGHTGKQLPTYVARYRTFKQPEMSSSVPDHFEARHKRTVLFKRTDSVSACLVRSLSRQQRSPPVIRNARSLQLTPALQDVG